MTSYIIIAGDTFALISRKAYGTEQDAGLIARANPGVSEPLTAGTEIVLPDNPNAPDLQSTDIPSEVENEIALKIEGQRFRFWEAMIITRSIDTMDTLEFNSPFDPDDIVFRETFKPFEYKSAEVTVGGKALFTGTILTPVPNLDINRKTIGVNGYSSPGVLSDCSMPASAFPLEFNGMGLKDIAESITAPFGLSVVFTEEQGPIFDRVSMDPGQKCFSFLAGLAKQRNLIIASTEDGKLLFQRAVESGNPVARLSQGIAPTVSITPNLNPQEYYSHITGLQPTVVGIKGSQHTVKNPLLKGVIRPFTFKAEDSTGGDLKEVVEAKMGRMFANVVDYSLGLSTWRDSQGGLWKPNTTITLTAPGVMIYSEYEFLIRRVELTRENNNETAVLELIIPEAFKGQIPGRLPWG